MNGNGVFRGTSITIGVIGLGMLGLGVAGCLPGASMDKEKLIQTASFDHGCPPANIRLVSEDDDGMAATGRYVLEVCGANKKYKRAGTMYYDADQGLVVDGKKVAN